MADWFHATVGAQFNLRPARSQVVLVALTFVALVAMITGFIFLWHKPAVSWVPLSISLVLLVGIGFGWASSRRDVDMQGSSPTQIQDAHGHQIVTDTRALQSPQVIQGIERLFSGLAHREPLPEPDGLLDNNGNPLPDTKAAASERVEYANKAAQRIATATVTTLGVDEPIREESQPILDGPPSEQLERTNIPDS